MQYGLSDDIIEQLRGVIAAQPRIKQVCLYGSRARGDFTNTSDIDLAVYGDNDFTFDDYLNLTSKIDDLPIVFKIDVVDVNKLSKQALLESIKRDGVVFWKGN